MSLRSNIPVVGIVGGGFTGAAVALHLAGLTTGRRPRIIVFEPRNRLGAGLAYDSSEPVHRINVPATKMSVYPDDPSGFSRWLAETDALADDAEAFAADGLPYPRRAVFGRYMASQLEPLIASGIVERWQTVVSKVNRKGEAWEIHTRDGAVVAVDILVLAVSHPSPSLPGSLAALADSPKLVADATRPDALAQIEPTDRVLVVGNGLTAADVIAALRRRGHSGPITAISRRGLRSRGHPKSLQEPFGDFTTRPSISASELLHRIRAEIERATAEGLSWHAVLDAVRAQAQLIWSHLPIAERRRIVRHVRPFWDVHRFRIAPQVEQALDEAVADGGLTILAASIISVEKADTHFHLRLRPRFAKEPIAAETDAIVVTTGPGHGDILRSQDFLSGLASDGILALCPTGLGILNDMDARVLTPDGKRMETLLIAGPLARGTVGELMGLPQVTEHAVLVAREVAGILLALDAPQTPIPATAIS